MSDACTHDLDAEFIYPSDVDVLQTANDGEDVVFTLAALPGVRDGPGGGGPERVGG